ncbi:hypothetical protein [Flavisericum labens]|uniref:hypothetical protein n=1 Tax=Flavisericum labens TaxID=3377112 RepID=UPI00387ADC48
MEIKDTLKHLEDLKSLQDERNKVYREWLKNTLTIASAFLAIFVSLKSESEHNCIESVLFIITISTMSLGILLGVIILFADTVVLNLSLIKKKEQILQLLDDQKVGFDRADRPTIYKYLEYICFSCLIVSLLCLTSYSILINL